MVAFQPASGKGALSAVQIGTQMQQLRNQEILNKAKLLQTQADIQTQRQKQQLYQNALGMGGAAVGGSPTPFSTNAAAPATSQTMSNQGASIPMRNAGIGMIGQQQVQTHTQTAQPNSGISILSGFSGLPNPQKLAAQRALLIDDPTRGRAAMAADKEGMAALQKDMRNSVGLAQNMAPQERSAFLQQKAQEYAQLGYQREAQAAAQLAQASPQEQEQVLRQLNEQYMDKTKLFEMQNLERTEERKAMGKSAGAYYDKVQSDAMKADETMTAVDQLRALNPATGLDTEMKAKISEYASIISPGLAKSIMDVSSYQQANAVLQRMVNSNLRLNKGPQTDADAMRIQNEQAALKDTPQAWKFNLNTMEAMAKRQQEQAAFLEQATMPLTEGGKGLSIRQARAEWNKFARSTPLISRNLKDADGLPTYYYQFADKVKQLSPNISDAQIQELWREENARK